jgi:hypothetical protein
MEAMGWLKISQEKSGVAIFRAILKQNYVIIYLSNTFKPFYHKFQTSFIQTLKKIKVLPYIPGNTTKRFGIEINVTELF